MSHRLGAVSSDYCSVCQNGLLPSAAATASNPLWPLAAPFLMTNCQPAPTKARLKCQHRMTKGPGGSSETNCVQYELILYSRAGPRAAGGWLLARLKRMQGQGWRGAQGRGAHARDCLPASAHKGRSPSAGGVSWGVQVRELGTRRGLSASGEGACHRPRTQDRVHCARRGPSATGPVPISLTTRAVLKTPKLRTLTPREEMVVQRTVTTWGP